MARTPRPTLARTAPRLHGRGWHPPGVAPRIGAALPSYESVGNPILSAYPTVIDTSPNFADGLTPLTAQWINLLQQMLEAVQAEIGPIPPGITRRWMPGPLPANNVVDSLMKLMGQQTDIATITDPQKSYAGLCSAVAGNGKPAGTLFGVQRVQVTRSSWTVTEYDVAFTNPFGRMPGNRRPIAWGYPHQRVSSGASDTFQTGPAKIVARVATFPLSGTTQTFNVKWAAATAFVGTGLGLLPASGPSHTIDICLLYMCTDDD